jgi:hypothetical protein
MATVLTWDGTSKKRKPLWKGAGVLSNGAGGVRTTQGTTFPV